MSRTNENFQSYLRLALPLMAKYKIPITPQNYAVWYRYVSGENGELQKTIDGMLRDGQNFTEEINDKLYQRFGLGGMKRNSRKFKTISEKFLFQS
jgi:hypothetical protein